MKISLKTIELLIAYRLLSYCKIEHEEESDKRRTFADTSKAIAKLIKKHIDNAGGGAAAAPDITGLVIDVDKTLSDYKIWPIYGYTETAMRIVKSCYNDILYIQKISELLYDQRAINSFSTIGFSEANVTIAQFDTIDDICAYLHSIEKLN